MKRVSNNLQKQQMDKKMYFKLFKIDQVRNIESEITPKVNPNLLLTKQL